MNSSKNPSVEKESFEHELDFEGKLTKHQKQIAYRRQKIFSLLVRGVTNTYELAEVTGISQSTASRDVQFLKTKAIEEMSFHIHERLPMEYKICSHGITEVHKHAWDSILNDTKANKTATLALIAELYKSRLEMATNAFVITESLNQLEIMKNQILGLGAQKQATNNRLSTTPTIGAIK